MPHKFYEAFFLHVNNCVRSKINHLVQHQFG
jgi:hypothetical protein